MNTEKFFFLLKNLKITKEKMIKEYNRETAEKYVETLNKLENQLNKELKKSKSLLEAIRYAENTENRFLSQNL